MAIVVIGGQARNIGKTSVIAALIAALPHLQWTAIKISQHSHGLPHSQNVSFLQEHDPTSGTDTARFLAAGATRSFWVRVRPGHLSDAMPRIHEELAAAPNAIIESNSILRYLTPDLYLAVLAPANSDFKISARSLLPRADAILWSGHPAATCPAGLPNVPEFLIEPPAFTTPELVEFVATRLRPQSA